MTTQVTRPSATLGRMSELGQRLGAAAVLLVAAFVLFKVVLGVVSFVAWVAVGLVALVAIVWAARVLL
jgi:hypothetical protein